MTNPKLNEQVLKRAEELFEKSQKPKIEIEPFYPLDKRIINRLISIGDELWDSKNNRPDLTKIKMQISTGEIWEWKMIGKKSIMMLCQWVAIKEQESDNAKNQS